MNLIKPFITEFKRVNLYGDCHVTEKGFYFPFRGKSLRVKILGLFWITYKYYTVRG